MIEFGVMRAQLTQVMLCDQIQWAIQNTKCSSPVPEMMPGKERPWLGRVQFENDLQHIKSQKTPLSIWYHRVLLIQTNEHSIHQNNQVIDIHKHSETHNTNIWNSNSVAVQKKKSECISVNARSIFWARFTKQGKCDEIKVWWERKVLKVIYSQCAN